jgi:diacylglycerol kinase family enzyme
VKELRLGDLIKAGLSALKPDVEYGDSIECIICREAEVELPIPRNLQVDGEFAGKVTYLRARVEREGIRVVVPGEGRLLGH